MPQTQRKIGGHLILRRTIGLTGNMRPVTLTITPFTQ